MCDCCHQEEAGPTFTELRKAGQERHNPLTPFRRKERPGEHRVSRATGLRGSPPGHGEVIGSQRQVMGSRRGHDANGGPWSQQGYRQQSRTLTVPRIGCGSGDGSMWVRKSEYGHEMACRHPS